MRLPTHLHLLQQLHWLWEYSSRYHALGARYLETSAKKDQRCNNVIMSGPGFCSAVRMRIGCHKQIVPNFKKGSSSNSKVTRKCRQQLFQVFILQKPDKKTGCIRERRRSRVDWNHWAGMLVRVYRTTIRTYMPKNKARGEDYTKFS